MAVAGMVNNDYEEELLWAATFTAANKELIWNPEESEKDGDTEEEDKDDPSVKPGHRLLLKNAVLMPEAKKDDVCIIQVESEGYNMTKVVTPIIAMKGGTDYQQYVDILVPNKATFKLIQGEGPIHLVGSHCVNFYGYRDVGGDLTDGEGDDSMDGDTEEKKTEEKKPSGKKESPSKAGDKTSPTKEAEVKKASPEKEKAEKKGSPVKTRETSGGKKRKASEEKTSSAEKKKKEDR